MASSVFDPTGDDPYATNAKARVVQNALQQGMVPNQNVAPPWAPNGGQMTPAGYANPANQNTGVTGGAASASQAPAAQHNYNTNGYAQPGFTAMNPGNVMPGWDATKWADPNYQSPKYGIGRILSQYDPKQGLSDAAMAEIQKAYAGTTKTGDDTINVPGVGTIDVLTSPEHGGNWWWGAETDANGKPLQQQAVNGALGGTSGAGGAYQQGFGGNAPYAASQWLNNLLKSLGVNIGGF